MARELLLRLGINYLYYPGRCADRDWLLKELSDADALVVTPYQRVDEDLMVNASRLSIIVIHGSGTDLVDLELACLKGICVANVADVVAEAVAEHVLALILSSIRNVVAGDKAVRRGEWVEGMAPRRFLGRSLKGVKVGIIGLGRVGTEVARLLKLLRAEVLYWSRRRKKWLERELGIKYLDFTELLKSADAVVVAVALTPETKGLIGSRELSLLRDGALIVNVSRGGVIDENALIKELRSGRIRAALDVFSKEPLPKNHPLTTLDNVILTPHIAGYTLEAVEGMGLKAALIIANYLLRGRVPETAVNREVCERRSKYLPVI